jgi:RNA polymerase sigma-70 factor (ECF subfamily)
MYSASVEYVPIQVTLSMPESFPGDEILLQRLSRGDDGALLQLHRRYAGLVYSMARRVLADAGAAEEVTQDVFLKLWQKSARYDPARGRFSTWLLSVARFAAIDRLRHDGRHPTVSIEGDEAGEPPPLERMQPADRVDWQRGQELRILLQQLPTEQRQVLELAYFGGMTHSELAEYLHLPLGTVKGRLRLAIEKLRSLWLEDIPG